MLCPSVKSRGFKLCLEVGIIFDLLTDKHLGCSYKGLNGFGWNLNLAYRSIV